MSDDITNFFRDPDASSVVTLKAQQIAAPVVRGQALSVDEMMMGGGLRVVMYILDRSPSMEPVAQMLLQDFNTVLVPAIKEAREDDISALRIGGISFSSDITPIWIGTDANGQTNYFHDLDNLPKLTKGEFNPDSGWATALHAAIIEGTARGMKFAAQTQADTGIAPDVDIVILSDGMNNEAPHSPDQVKAMVNARDKTRVRFSYFYFDTSSRRNPQQSMDEAYSIAASLGIENENTQVFAAKPNETPSERSSRFRRAMRVMSRVSASKGTSAVMAAAAVAATPMPTDEEELV